MSKNCVIFKSPYLRYRKEDFGGIVKLNLKTIIINKPQYDLINKIEKVVVYEDLNEIEKKIVDKLIDNNLLLEVDLKRAEEIGFKH